MRHACGKPYVDEILVLVVVKDLNELTDMNTVRISSENDICMDPYM